LSALEDQSDVERTLSGELDAFEGIVRRWQKPLIHLAYRFSHDQTRSEDMAQEAFLRAYRSLSSWRIDSAFSTWLYAVALNCYRSEYRRKFREPVGLEDVAEPRDMRAADSGLEKRSEEQQLHRTVQSLPPKYREAVILFYLQEMSLKDTADVLGIAEGTLKARLFRGREMLRKKLVRDAKRKEEA